MAMEPRVEVEAIGETELPRVRTLAHEIWPEAYASILPADRIANMVADIYSLETLAADIHERAHLYWIATVGGADAAYASGYREGDRAWIKKLYVRNTTRGLGVGRLMLAAIVDAFPGVRSHGLYVNDQNQPAIAFYRSQGFEIEDHVPVQMGPYTYVDYVMSRAIG